MVFKKKSYPIENKELMNILMIFETKHITGHSIILNFHEKSYIFFFLIINFL